MDLPTGRLSRAAVPATFISVLVWANEALVVWVLVQLLAHQDIPQGWPCPSRGCGRLITLWSMVALAAGISLLWPIHQGPEGQNPLGSDGHAISGHR